MDWVLAIRTDWLTPLMKGFTFLGDEEFFLLFLPLAYWFWRKDIMGRAGMVLLGTFVINAVIKSIFQIPRPDMVLHLVSVDDWSFPSGHSQGAMVLWGWLAYELREKRFTAIAALLIAGVGFSRVYLGVHYPTDVLGGFGIGFLTLVAYGWLLQRETVGWRHLGPTRQSLIVFIILMGLFMLVPELSEVAIKGGAAFIGFLTGYFHEKKYLNCRFNPGMNIMLSKLVTGIVGILIIWIGLKQIFISIAYTTEMATFIRYTLLGGWISYGAPFLFCHFGWNSTDAKPV